jgi:dienelactone hydrolase
VRVLAACSIAILLGAGATATAVERQVPMQRVLPTESNPSFQVPVYAPQPAQGTEGKPARPAMPVIFYAGEWGWRPLQQDTASSLAASGRYVLGIDSPDYFNRKIEPATLASEFERFRAFLNERAGRPKEAPVILVGFAAGAEIVPYILNRVDPAGVRGAVLIAPDKKGAYVFRVSMQLRLDSPPDEVFDVEAELRRMAPIPVVMIEGTLDPHSEAKALSAVPRGPHKYAPIVGGDRQFKEVRESFFRLLDDSLRWIDGLTAPFPGRPPGPEPAPGATAAPPAPSGVDPQ